MHRPSAAPWAGLFFGFCAIRTLDIDIALGRDILQQIA
jgi:hypothetical protein